MGPTKGGIRFAPGVSLGECAALAMWMTLQVRACFAFPFGGAKGGVRCDPNRLSRRRDGARRRAATPAEFVADHRPRPRHPRARHGHRRARDVMADGHLLAAGRLSGARDRHRQAARSSAAPPAGAPATGLGRRLLPSRRRFQHLDWDARAASAIVIQGFGNVGSVIARELLARRRERSSRVSDVLRRHRQRRTASTSTRCRRAGSASTAFLRGFPGGDAVGRREVLETPCDILVPAALERQITDENARSIDCQLVARGGQRPHHPGGRPASWPSAASGSCPTCSPTPAASPSATSSGRSRCSASAWSAEEVDDRAFASRCRRRSG